MQVHLVFDKMEFEKYLIVSDFCKSGHGLLINLVFEVHFCIIDLIVYISRKVLFQWMQKIYMAITIQLVSEL